MSGTTPLATYRHNFRLAFWPDRAPASDLAIDLSAAGNKRAQGEVSASIKM